MSITKPLVLLDILHVPPPPPPLHRSVSTGTRTATQDSAVPEYPRRYALLSTRPPHRTATTPTADQAVAACSGSSSSRTLRPPGPSTWSCATSGTRMAMAVSVEEERTDVCARWPTAGPASTGTTRTGGAGVVARAGGLKSGITKPSSTDKEFVITHRPPPPPHFLSVCLSVSVCLSLPLFVLR